MKRVVVGIIQFNDGGVLKYAFESIRSHVDSVVVVDGSWYGGNVPSIDGSRSVALSYGATWVDSRDWASTGAGEQAAREAVFEHTSEGDLVLFMDADERLMYGGEHLRRIAQKRLLWENQSANVVLIGSLGVEGDSGRAVWARRLYGVPSKWDREISLTTHFPIVIRNSPEFRPAWRAEARLLEPRYSGRPGDNEKWLVAHGKTPFVT